MDNPSSPYFGDQKVQMLQKARDEQVSDLRDMPGAVVHARTFSTDDPNALGWGFLREVMAREGLLTLRGADESTIDRARGELAEFSPFLHYWDMFVGDAQMIREVCGPLASAPLPLSVRRTPDKEITPDVVHEVQGFLADQGVSPFSKDALLGLLFPAKLVVLQHEDGRIAAAGFAAMTHNRHSPFHGAAWVGLIAVDPELRGLGLGKQVDAMCNLAAVDELGATATLEFVAQDNIPSRAMLESCGLRQLQGKSLVLFSTSADRITR